MQHAQQLQSEAVGQAHVGDHDVKAALRQLGPRFVQASRGLYAVAFAQQREFAQRAQVGFVIDDEHAGLGVGVHTTMVSSSEAASGGLLDGRKVTVKALPSTCPRGNSSVRRE